MALLFFTKTKNSFIISSSIIISYRNDKCFWKGDVIIHYEIFSETGEYHKSIGKENEDAVKVITSRDYAYFILSDGAGCSQFAKEAAWSTVNAAGDCCQNYGYEFFTDKKEDAQKRLIFDVQQALYDRAKELGTDLTQMMCTLVMLCINEKTNQYVTVHIGDGLIAKQSPNEVSIISYPENGITKQYTYFVNSPNVFQHLRSRTGTIDNTHSLFLGTDGCFEDCCTTEQYQARVKTIQSQNNCSDDATYCIIFP